MSSSSWELGLHVSTAGGIHKAPDRAAALGCRTFQVFVTNPRAWAARPLDPRHVEVFRERVGALGFKSFFVHAPYLPNVASPDDEIWRRSVAALEEVARRTAVLGGRYVVTHMGSHKGGGIEVGQRRAAAALTRVLAAVPGIVILMEDAARYSNQVGTTVAELAAIYGLVGAGVRDRVALCIDTCHAHVMGYDLGPAGDGLETLAREVRRYFGAAGVKLLHINDAAGGAGSKVDRHEHIGYGTIGAGGFKRLINHPFFGGLPMVLETPMEDGWDARNLAAIRRLKRR